MTRLAAVVLALVACLTACSGDDGGSPDNGDDPRDVLADAKAELDATSGVRLLLETSELPEGVAGVLKAEGVANHQPAFEGSIELVFAGFTGEVDVTAVDGSVYAVLPYTEKFVPVDPSEYGAPDPSALMSPEGGISSWLTAATDVSQGDQTRDGGDLLTEYSGTLEGSAVVASIPSADPAGEFDAVFRIDEEGLLRSASVTGAFYKGKPELTYDVTLTDYGTEQEITEP